MLSEQFRVSGSIQTLSQLGIRLNEKGELSFDESKFNALLLSDLDSVEEFFTSDKGFSVAIDAVVERLAGEENSVLINRNETLQIRIDRNEIRIIDFTGRLDKQRERLFLTFVRLEQTIGRLQSNLGAIQNIQPVPSILTGSR